MVQSLVGKGKVTPQRIKDLMEERKYKIIVTNAQLQKLIYRITAKYNDNINNVKRFVFENTENNKSETQGWFVFGTDLFSGKDEATCTWEDVNIGLGRSRQEENVPDFYHGIFLIGKYIQHIYFYFY